MNIKKFVLYSVILVLLISCSSMVKPSKINRIAIETELADLNVDFFPSSLIVSPDVHNIAYAEDTGLGLRVVVNDIPYLEYDNIGIGTPIFSPNSEYAAYFSYNEGYSGGLFGLFSSESYWEVVVDTVEYGIYYDGFLDNSLVISPDSKHIAYGVLDEYYGSYIIYDHHELPDIVVLKDLQDTVYVWDVHPPFVFSPNSEKFAYVFEDVDADFYVIVNDDAGKGFSYIYANSLVFSPNSEKLAFAVQTENYEKVAVNDQELGEYQEVAGISLTFSPDSEHLAYAAFDDLYWFVVRDEIEGKSYDLIGSIVFSPNSKHLAYTAKDGEEWIVVLDEKEIARHSGILQKSLTFSPNSKNFVYAAQVDSGVVVFEDGKPSEMYEAIATAPTYSPNGKYLVYTIEENKTQSVAINGIKGQSYPAVISHNGGRVVFDDDHHIHYLVIKDDNKVYLIEENL